MTALELQKKDAADASLAEAKFVAAYARRRKWSRTDTTRWLYDRSEPLLAWLRRKARHAPSHSRQIGTWLKDNEVKTFDRAHARIAPLTDDERDHLLIETLLN
jgi:hypothetical protein